MANLKVSIVVRTTDPNGKRGWVPATGKPIPQVLSISATTREVSPSTLRRGAFSTKLKLPSSAWSGSSRPPAWSSKFPDEQPNGTDLHHWHDCLNSYVTSLRGKTKRNGWKYNDKSIREREANVREFAHLINKPFIENYTTADMLRYKEHLYSLGRANDTVLNKLSCIVTWLRRNGLVSIVGLLPGEERPERRETEGHPYSPVQVESDHPEPGVTSHNGTSLISNG